MRHLLWGLGAVLVASTMSGCIINANGGDSNPDMNLDVTFAGQGCQDANVGSVRLTFVNPVFGQPEDFPCTDPQGLLIKVPSVPPDSYRIRLDAYDATNTSTITFSSAFSLNQTQTGSDEFALDLVGTTEVVTDFTFAGYVHQDGTTETGMTCQEAGVSTVSLSVDGQQNFANLPCHDASSGRDAASLTGIQPGNHDFTVDAFDSSGNKLYSSTFQNVSVQQGSNELTFDVLALQHATSGLKVAFTFGASESDCSGAGVQSVDFLLFDQSHSTTPIYDTTQNNAPYTCGDSSAGVTQLPVGVYFLTASGTNGAGTTYQTPTNGVRVYAPAGATPTFTVNLQ